MRVVYMDELLIYNMGANLLSLMAARALAGVRVSGLRLFLAALFGTAYAALEAVLRGPFSTPAAKISAGVLMCLVSFGPGAGGLRCGALAFLAAGAFRGFLAAFLAKKAGLGAFFALFFLFYGLCLMLFKGGAASAVRGQVCDILIERGGRSVRLRALADTGNALRDPITGREVTVISARAAGELFPPAVAELMKSGDAAGAVGACGGGLRLVPCRTAAGRGLLAAFRPDRLEVNGKPAPGLVAVSPDLDSEGGFEALLGRENGNLT
ncbi:MAG: sigma-E processing peptidase SpoIIGA [Oscillospiraceae bacterium]|nr:sigma-E processing peptidase SpoIIGA [Oscillospiraceae bacterium]